jgi:uroporphyrinogen decarboxylase
MAGWSKRRRLEAVIAGEKPDRLPVALWRHWPGDDQDAAALAAAHLKWQRDYDWDLLKVGPDSNYSVADWGVKDRWVGHIEGTRETTFHSVKTVEDWAALRPLDPGRGALARQIEALSLVRRGAGDEVPILATVFSPLSQAKHIAGELTIQSHSRSHPALFHEALAVITESTLRFIEAAGAAGVDGIYYAVQHARYPLMGRGEFAEFGRAYDLQVLQAAGDFWLNMLHIHSGDLMFDLVADYPVQLVNWHDRESGISLRDGLAQIKGAASGGVDQWAIHQEFPEQALAEARDAMEQTGGRRLLLGTGCVVMVTTPLRNLRALRDFVGDTQ